MQSQCMLFLLAGYETASTALGFLTYDLAMNQEVQDRLHKEIDEHFTQVVVRYIVFNKHFEDVNSDMMKYNFILL